MTVRVALASSLVLLAALAGTGAPALAQPAAAAPDSGAVAVNAPRGTGEVTYEEMAGVLRPWLLTLPGVRAVLPVEGEPQTLRLIADRDMILRLSSLRERLNAEGADRVDAYGHYVNAVASMLRDTNPFQLPALRTVIRPTQAIDEFETITSAGGSRNVVVRRPFVPGLEEVVVADTPTSVVFMPAARLAALELTADAAYAQGRANLVEVARAARWSEENGLRVGQVDGSYETSLLAVDALWDQMEADLGGPIAVAIPVRGRLVIGRADRPDQVAALTALARREAVGDLAITDQVLVREAGRWRIN